MAFEQIFAIVVGEEGGLTTNPADPGNWSGGAVGRGVCRGSKFGISAAAYPSVDIAALTVEEARAIYQRDYWQPVGADQVPAPLALLLFDAAVNNGVGRAVRWLQTAVGVTADGTFGPETSAAVHAHAGDGAALCAEFQAQRLVFMAALPTWRSFALGWARRLSRLPFEAIQLGSG